MREIINTLNNIWNIKELRNKLIFTLLMVLVYRFGTHISLPFIDMTKVDDILGQSANNNSGGGLMGLLSSFTGGAFSRASVLALGIMPYITASIIIQLAGLVIPYIQKLQKDGESGRKTITNITRWLTIGVCLLQAPAYLGSIIGGVFQVNQFHTAYLVNTSSIWEFWIPNILILVSGTLFAVWMGEKITDKGIGNGISILIMVGILAGFPTAFMKEFGVRMAGDGRLMMIFFEVIAWLLVLVLCIILTVAVRQIPVQYVTRTKTGSLASISNAARQYIPLKLNSAGVMPIIFGQALMFAIGWLAGKSSNPQILQLGNVFSWQYSLVFALLIIVFSFFYTAITIPVGQMADDLKRNGGLIPGVKPGTDTSNYLDTILSYITLPGAIFLAFIAILPALVKITNIASTQEFALFFGGTSLLIMVGVMLDTVQQVRTYLLNNHYDGLMDSRLSRRNRG